MADITFDVAQIGGGKSFCAVEDIAHELINTDHAIVTTCPVILQFPRDVNEAEKLADMIIRRRVEIRNEAEERLYWTMQEFCDVFGSRPVNVRERLLWITRQQASEFWKYLPLLGVHVAVGGLLPVHNTARLRECSGWKLPEKKDSLYGELTDFSLREGGQVFDRVPVHYVIDEVHNLFSARAWKARPDCETYMSQLRHYDDSLNLISQHPEKVDKNFRRNATCWKHYSNYGKQWLPFGVKLPGKFRVRVFQQAEMPGRGDKPTGVYWRSLGKPTRCEYLYKTMEGDGVVGSTKVHEDKGKRGLHWGIYVVIGLFVIFLSIEGPRLFIGGVAGVANKELGLVVPVAKKQSAGGGAPPVPEAVKSARVAVPSVVALPPASYYPPVIHAPAGLVCVGRFEGFGVTELIFSDGRVARGEEIQAIGDRYVRAFGYPDKIPFSTTVGRTIYLGDWQTQSNNPPPADFKLWRR